METKKGPKQDKDYTTQKKTDLIQEEHPTLVPLSESIVVLFM